MATNRARGFFMVICLLLCKDGWLRHPARQRSLCGDWTPYLDGKCVKILETTGSKNQAEAEVVCWSSYSTLISVKTSKEQQFLQPFLFDENKLEASVWLGLTQHGHSREFKWNDGSTMLFNNLVQHNTTENHYRCVAMASGRGINEEGLWVKSDCEMNNAVVCERESRTMNASDSTFMKDAPAQVIVQNDLEEKILLKAEKECDEKFGLLKQASLQTRDFMKEAAEKITAAIEHVKMAPEKRTDRSPAQKSVPIGFIYVQLPEQDPPNTLWPQTSWKEVGSQYAGLFFRVEGGDAAPFGQLQGDNTRRLVQVFYESPITPSGDPEIPFDGSWSGFANTGKTGTGDYYGLKFRLTTGEVRPKNKAVKLWLRIN